MVAKVIYLPAVVVQQSITTEMIYRWGFITIQAKASHSGVQLLLQVFAHLSWLDAECLLDPDLIHNMNTEALSFSISTNQSDFIYRINQCNRACVLTNDLGTYSEVCHIVPHSKGHQVIYFLVEFILSFSFPAPT